MTRELGCSVMNDPKVKDLVGKYFDLIVRHMKARRLEDTADWRNILKKLCQDIRERHRFFSASRWLQGFRMLYTQFFLHSIL